MNIENIRKSYKLMNELFEHEQTISNCHDMGLPANEGFILVLQGCEKVYVTNHELKLKILQLVTDVEREQINNIKQELETL